MDRRKFSTRLLLASRSPRRADLLRAAGLEFEVCAADVDESVRPGESPAEYVQRLASAKTAAVAALPRSEGGKDCAFKPAPRIVILGADTSVVVDDEILGKPVDDKDAAAMLRRLSGRGHEVITGLSIRVGSRELRHVETTAVYFEALDEEDIAWYVQSGEGRDKAGAYAIQGLASRLIPRIEGSYANVVGLPIAAVCALIRKLNTGV
jgi:septum formation protein